LQRFQQPQRRKFATLCQPIPPHGPWPGSERRLTVAVSWALARAATLDTLEHFEESYALNEEFREWLLCLEERPDLLEATVLMVPKNLRPSSKVEGDGLLEI
jgi:hypothetical protein